MRMIRKESSSRLLSFALAILLFPVTAILTACFSMGLIFIAYAIAHRAMRDLPVLETLIVGVFVAIPILAAFIVSRGAYLAMRWEIVDSEFGYCSRCGYDLTGNVSGVCPECGTGIDEE